MSGKLVGTDILSQKELNFRPNKFCGILNYTVGTKNLIHTLLSANTVKVTYIKLTKTNITKSSFLIRKLII